MDVHVNGLLGMLTFEPLTEEAHQFIEANVETQPWNRTAIGGFHIDSTDMANSIIEGMLADGLAVSLNGEQLELKEGYSNDN